ncbi:ribosomal protein S7A [Hypoxylon texense]
MASQLGLSCPSKGQFYVCETAAVRFIGCCTVNPCEDGSGSCPQSALAPTSFSSDHYDAIPPQNCAAPSNSSHWFTCQGSTPPFLGCCSINPCQNDGCPTASLLPATLSDDAGNAQIFLSNTSSSPSSSSSTSATDSSTSSAPDASGSSGYSLSLGAILGIAIGCTALVAIILAFLAYRCGWLARHRKHKKEAGEATKHPSAQSPYTPSAYAASEGQWQEGNQSGTTSPGFPSPGFAPYSPEQYQSYRTPAPQSHLSSESWQGNSRHVSQMSELSGWDSAAAEKKQHLHSPLLASELDGRHTELQVISELPSTPLKPQ